MPNVAMKSREQSAAEIDLKGDRPELAPFVVAAEATRMAMVFTDAGRPGDPIIFANDAFLALTGYERDEVLGQTFSFLSAHTNNEDARAQVAKAFSGDSGGHFEMRHHRKDGSLFWAAVFTCPVPNASGRVVQHFVSFVDLTDHMREAEHLRFLLDELNHRTQNTLATVQAIAVQTLRGVADESVVEAFEGRILALSKAHSLLGRNNWDQVTVRDVLERILEPFGLHGERAERISLTGDKVPLTPQTALSLAMAFHELAANAVEHGAFSTTTGRVDIGWRVEGAPRGDRMLLRWAESGGPPVAPPGPRGFGLHLIEGGLAQDLDGDVHVALEPAGLVCRIAMPLPPRPGAGS